MRIVLLLSVVWIIRLTAPLFCILGRPISGRDLISIGGGLFLLAKATIEIHERLEGEEGHSSAGVRPSFAAVIAQIAVLDIVFSLAGGARNKGRNDRLGISLVVAYGSFPYKRSRSRFCSYTHNIRWRPSRLLAVAHSGSLPDVD